MKMIEEDTAEEDGEVDDMFAIDWSETAYDLPEPNLITEKSFNFHTGNFICYKEYFDFMRGTSDIRKTGSLNKSNPTGKSEQPSVYTRDPAHPSNTNVNPSDTPAHPSSKSPVHKSNTHVHPSNTSLHSPNTSEHPSIIPIHPPITVVKPSNTPVHPSTTSLDQSSAIVPLPNTIVQPSQHVPLRPPIPPVVRLKSPGNLPAQLPQVPFQRPPNVPQNNITPSVSDDHFEGLNTTKYHLLLQEPRFSKILPAERRFYHAFMKNKNKLMEKPENHVRMKDLLMKIRSEQEEYQQFLHHCASVNMHSYLYLSEYIRNNVLGRLTGAVQKLVQPPHKLFKHMRVFNFSNMVGPQNPTFTFIRRVCEQGVISKFKMPEMKGNLSSASLPLPEKKHGMSEDMVQSMLMTEHGQVYIQQDSLLAIMEALVVPTREYVLPVKVKEIKINEDQKRTVVVVENPLPRRHLSTRDVNKQYYDHILQSRHGNHSDKQKASGNQPGVPGEDPVVDGSDDEGDDVSAQLQVNLFSLRDLCVLVEARPGEQDEQSQKKFHVASKCEYQVSLGFEQFSIIDLCQLWWNSKIANTDVILCARVDVRNDALIRNDMYTRDVLCPPACPYNPYVFCNHLYHVFKELQLLPPGSYLAEHGNGSPTINIHKETESGSLSFEAMYRDVLNSRQFIVDNTSPWLPIDTTILPKGFAANEWMTCLFSVKNTGKKSYPHNSRRGRGRGRKQHAKNTSLQTSDNSVNGQGWEVPLNGNNMRQMTSYESDDF